MYVFERKKAVVVGGSGGIGSAVSRMLVRNGASVVIHGSHQSEKFSRLENELNLMASSGQKIECVIQELRPDVFMEFEDSLLGSHVKSADILCVCYGPFLQVPCHEMTASRWNDVALMDFAFPGLCASLSLSNMLEKKWGRMLFFGGTRTYQVNGFKTNAAYGAAKTALSSLVKSLSLSYSSFGITSNLICPGFTETEYQSDLLLESLRMKMPSGKLVQPESIAEKAFLLLSSPDVNGVLLPVDYGWVPW